MDDLDPIMEATRAAMEADWPTFWDDRTLDAVVRLVSTEREKGEAVVLQLAELHELCESQMVIDAVERCIAIVEDWLGGAYEGSFDEMRAALRSELSPPTTPEQQVCTSCNGSGQGTLDGRTREWVRCGDCNGTGYADRISRTWDVPSPSPQPEETP